MSEKELIYGFINTYIQHNPSDEFEINIDNHSYNMDVMINTGVHKIGLEGKIFKDSRNSSGKFHQLFGQILKGRKQNVNEICKVEYGFLISENDKDLFIKYLNRLNYHDLITFCTAFDCNWLYIYNKEAKSYKRESIIDIATEQHSIK